MSASASRVKTKSNYYVVVRNASELGSAEDLGVLELFLYFIGWLIDNFKFWGIKNITDMFRELVY